MSRSMTMTKSPYWWEPGVTKLIAEARHDVKSRERLVELVYRPAFRRIDKWLKKAGFKRWNLEADDIFSILWDRDLLTAIKNASFKDREHFLRTLLSHARRRAGRLAKKVKCKQCESLCEEHSKSQSMDDPEQLAEYAELWSRLDKAVNQLPSPQLEIYTLYFLEGMSCRNIGSELNLSKTTVSRQKQAVFLQLLRELKNER